MSGSAFAVTHHAFSSGAGRTSDGNGSHASTLKSPSYTKSVSWQHYHIFSRLQEMTYSKNSHLLMDTVPEVRYVKSDIFQEELSARIDDRTSKNFFA